MTGGHESVLTSEVIAALAITQSDTIVDATIGGAGHFAAILSALGEGGTLVGIDADREAVERAREVYALDRRPDRPVTHIVNDNFRNLAHILERLQIGSVDAILFDLGWSGYQIAAPRGFSFAEEQPLLMTYSDAGTTAAELVNSIPETELADLLYTYGEEHFSRQIAHAIVLARAKKRILTSGDLVAAICSGTPRRYQEGKLHPATKTFQALRIATNDEFGALKEGLAAALIALAPEGRLAVITFHSVEDRIVKEILRSACEAHVGAMTPKKPITPKRSEVLKNRRARSAKLRVFTRFPSPVSVDSALVPHSYA